jgi:hypothetical protein
MSNPAIAVEKKVFVLPEQGSYESVASLLDEESGHPDIYIGNASIHDERTELDINVRCCERCQCAANDCLCEVSKINPERDIPVYRSGAGVNLRLIKYLNWKARLHGQIRAKSKSTADAYPLIPAELKQFHRWGAFELVQTESKLEKKPYSVRTGRRENIYLLGNHATYLEACLAVANKKFGVNNAAIGFGIVHCDGLTCLDFDHCVDPVTGEIRPDILKIIREINSYAEFSPSGTGVHIWVKGWQMPITRQGIKRGDAEIYSGGRGMTMTGKHVEGTPATLANPDLSGILARIEAGEWKEEKAAPTVKGQSSAASSVQVQRRDLKFSENEKLELLQHGDIESRTPFVVGNSHAFVQYPSQSEADQALCNLLAMEKADADAIDKVFRESSLYRKKWEREDYRERTITRALEAAKRAAERDSSNVVTAHVGSQVPVGTPPEIQARLDTQEGATRPVFPTHVMEGTSLYKNLVAPAVAASSKFGEFIFMPALQLMLNYLSGRVVMEFQETKLNMFLGEISPYGKYFKSSSCELAQDFYKAMNLSAIFRPSMKNSEGKIIIMQAGSPEGLGKALYRIDCRNSIMYHDELQKFVCKAGIESSAFSADLLTFFGQGDFVNMISAEKNNYSFEAGSYCFGWTFCTTDRAFNRLWPKLAGIATGLEDRMFFLVAPAEPRPATRYKDPEFSQAAISETRERINRAIAKRVYQCEDQKHLNAFEGLTPRALQLAYSFALYFAIDLGREKIDSDCINRAKALIDYREQALLFLDPIEGANEEAILQKTIIRELKRNCGKVSYRTLCRDLSYTDYGTYRWKTAYRGLVDEGIIIQWDERTANGQITRMVGLVRQEEN